MKTAAKYLIRTIAPLSILVGLAASAQTPTPAPDNQAAQTRYKTMEKDQKAQEKSHKAQAKADKQQHKALKAQQKAAKKDAAVAPSPQ